MHLSRFAFFGLLSLGAVVALAAPSYGLALVHSVAAPIALGFAVLFATPFVGWALEHRVKGGLETGRAAPRGVLALLFPAPQTGVPQPTSLS